LQEPLGQYRDAAKRWLFIEKKFPNRLTEVINSDMSWQVFLKPKDQDKAERFHEDHVVLA
jgi:hypothetical protein